MIGAILLTFRQRKGVKKQSYFNQISRNPSSSIELKEVETNKGVKINDWNWIRSLSLFRGDNIFFRCNDPEIRHTLGLKDSSEAKVFSKLRDLKDSF